MNSPFKFGNLVKGDYFINRAEEINRLRNNFQSGNNTILISPRRWGKSSLVAQSAAEVSDKSIRFAFINMQSFRDEASFYQSFCQEIFRASITRQEEILQAGKSFFKKLVPRISFGLDPQHDFTVSFDWQEVQKAKDEILNLAETISQKKKIKIVVCIDEFQNISKLYSSDSILHELRSFWMQHQRASYCLYGSKRHMMLEIFNTESNPFYRFGDLILLQKIHRDQWISYIESGFKKTGKCIGSAEACLIAETAKDHPYYVQQLAHEVWIVTDKTATRSIVQQSIDRVTETNTPFYQETIENLTNTQVDLLIAITENITHLTSAETMAKYKIGTPNNVRKNKVILQKKDILDFHGGIMTFLDPFFEHWFRGTFCK